MSKSRNYVILENRKTAHIEDGYHSQRMYGRTLCNISFDIEYYTDRRTNSVPKKHRICKNCLRKEKK